MSDQQSVPDTEVTIDDMWVNRLAQRLGVVIAQNERLMIENELLQARVKQLEQQQPEPSTNGDIAGSITDAPDLDTRV